MFLIEIEGKEYGLVSDWNEITLAKSLELLKENTPKGYYELITQAKDYKFDNEFWVKTLPLFYGKMISLLSDIPEKVIEQFTAEQRAKIYVHLAKYVNTLFYDEPKNLKEIKEFDFKGDRYYLPKSITKLGIEYPMADEPMQTFTESADLLLAGMNIKENKLEYAANIVAILCRKEGEAYDEKKMLERAEEFKELPMDIVWNVFFYFLELWNLYIINTANYLAGKENQNLITVH